MTAGRAGADDDDAAVDDAAVDDAAVDDAADDATEAEFARGGS